MRRHLARPYGQSVTVMRLASMVMALVVLWALYERLKLPETWQILVDGKSPQPTKTIPATETETLVSGPNDRDAAESAAIETLFDFVTDRAPLKSREMDAYWRLMDWSRTESFDELSSRASSDVPFTLLWELPEKHRGKLLNLQLHVRRVLEYDAPENPAGISKVYEAWGWTDESRSFPYVVVFTDRPSNLPIGTDIRAEINFVGYFLKIMSYTAFDHSRGAPLLAGRVRLTHAPVAATPTESNPWLIGLIIIGGVSFIGWTVWNSSRQRRHTRTELLENDLFPTVPSIETTPDASAAPFGHLQHPTERGETQNQFPFRFGEVTKDTPGS